MDLNFKKSLSNKFLTKLKAANPHPFGQLSLRIDFFKSRQNNRNAIKTWVPRKEIKNVSECVLERKPTFLIIAKPLGSEL